MACPPWRRFATAKIIKAIKISSTAAKIHSHQSDTFDGVFGADDCVVTVLVADALDVGVADDDVTGVALLSVAVCEAVVGDVVVVGVV